MKEDAVFSDPMTQAKQVHFYLETKQYYYFEVLRALFLQVT